MQETLLFGWSKSNCRRRLIWRLSEDELEEDEDENDDVGLQHKNLVESRFHLIVRLSIFKEDACNRKSDTVSQHHRS